MKMKMDVTSGGEKIPSFFFFFFFCKLFLTKNYLIEEKLGIFN